MTTTEPTTSMLAVASRAFWMMLGPRSLFLLAYTIVSQGSGWLTALDLAFLVVLAGVLAARFLEFRGGNPQTATGEPATPAHLRRYVIVAAPIGLGIWVVANVLGNHVFGQ
jgi:hypothetical protein